MLLRITKGNVDRMRAHGHDTLQGCAVHPAGQAISASSVSKALSAAMGIP